MFATLQNIARDLIPKDAQINAIILAATNHPASQQPPYVYAMPEDALKNLFLFRPEVVKVRYHMPAHQKRPISSGGEYSTYQKIDTALQVIQASAGVASAVFGGTV